MSTINKKEKIKMGNWLEIRKTLSRCSQNDLLGLIADLYGLSRSNRDFLEARFLKDIHIIEHYKSLIKKHVAPSEPWKESQKINLREAKQVLSHYKKATNDLIGLIDLMIYYVECGTDFLCEYGDMYEQYYMSLESVFDDVLKIMKQYPREEIQDFIERLKIILKKSDHMGWGYHDTLSQSFQNIYFTEL